MILEPKQDELEVKLGLLDTSMEEVVRNSFIIEEHTKEFSSYVKSLTDDEVYGLMEETEFYWDLHDEISVQEEICLVAELAILFERICLIEDSLKAKEEHLHNLFASITPNQAISDTNADAYTVLDKRKDKKRRTRKGRSLKNKKMKRLYNEKTYCSYWECTKENGDTYFTSFRIQSPYLKKQSNRKVRNFAKSNHHRIVEGNYYRKFFDYAYLLS